MSLIELLGLVFTVIVILNFTVGFFALKTSLAFELTEESRQKPKNEK